MIHELESKMYHDALVRETELSKRVLFARMELVSMEGEIILHKRRYGEDAGYKSAMERFDILRKALELACSMDDESHMYRLMNEQLQREKVLLNKKIEYLQNQLKAVEAAWKAK